MPVICSDANVPKEVVGDAGLIFKTGNIEELEMQMKKLEAMDQEDYKSMQQLGFNRVMAEYTVDRFIQRFQNLPQIADFGDTL